MSLYNNIKENQELFEMANLTKALTGLPVNLWMDSSGIERGTKHNSFRLKMQNDYGDKASPSELIPVSIDKDNPEILINTQLNIKKKDFKKVADFIVHNYDLLSAHVRGELDDVQLIDALKERQKVGV